jgi:hypothetical protein
LSGLKQIIQAISVDITMELFILKKPQEIHLTEATSISAFLKTQNLEFHFEQYSAISCLICTEYTRSLTISSIHTWNIVVKRRQLENFNLLINFSYTIHFRLNTNTGIKIYISKLKDRDGKFHAYCIWICIAMGLNSPG